MPAPAKSAQPRKPFRHEGEEARRGALIAAALDCLAEGGLQAATVRAIALRAGVTPGLIRHYFPSKDDLVEAAYQTLMQGLTGDVLEARHHADSAPRQRLGGFVRAALGPEAAEPGKLAAWAGFIGALHRAPALRAIHAASYRAFRDRLAVLIAAALAADGRPAPAAALRGQAIVVTAVLDGLWLEGGLILEAFAPGELASLGIAATEAILGLDLSPAPESAAS